MLDRREVDLFQAADLVAKREHGEHPFLDGIGGYSFGVGTAIVAGIEVEQRFMSEDKVYADAGYRAVKVRDVLKPPEQGPVACMIRASASASRMEAFEGCMYDSAGSRIMRISLALGAGRA